MPVLALICGLLALVPVRSAAEPAAPYQPAFEALVVVNLSVPERVVTAARARVGAITAHLEQGEVRVEPNFIVAESTALSGRAPRWFQFATEPAILDSLVFDWAGVEVLVDETWTRPAGSVRPLAIPLARRVHAGDVLVLNLRWDPDVRAPHDPNWQPEIHLEEFAEPPPGARLYVSEEASGIVSVIARADGRMVRGLPVGGRPRDMVWDPVSQRLFVAVAGTAELLAIDPVGQETIQRLSLGFGSEPTRVLLSADGQRVAVLAPGRDQVIVASATSLQEIARVRVGNRPVAMAEDPQSGRLFVTSPVTGQIDVVDPASAAVVARFGPLDSPGEIARLESGLLALGHTRSRRIDVLDPASGSVQSSTEFCGPVDGLLVIPRLDRLLALSNACASLAALRPERDIEFGSSRLAEAAGLPSMGPREAEVFVPLAGSMRILVLPAGLGGVTRAVDTGPGPWRVVAP